MTPVVVFTDQDLPCLNFMNGYLNYFLGNVYSLLKIEYYKSVIVQSLKIINYPEVN